MQDLQSVWPRLLFCASSSATFYLRECHPDNTEARAPTRVSHLAVSLHVAGSTVGKKEKQSPFPWGDMACAARSSQHVPVSGAVGQIACCQHHWDIARTMFEVHESLPASVGHIQVAVSCALQLAKVGFDSPDWRTLLMICADSRLILTRRTQACPPMAGSFSLLRLATERDRERQPVNDSTRGSNDSHQMLSATS